MPRESLFAMDASVSSKPCGLSRSASSRYPSNKRFARLGNGFSKKLDNHAASVSLYVAHYNLCRPHESLRQTPAMALGLTDHVWSIGELIDAALAAAGTIKPPQPRDRRGAFRVIEGGRAWRPKTDDPKMTRPPTRATSISI